jgi:hypothetical protein
VLLSLCPVLIGARATPATASAESVLSDHLLVTWYGNPHSKGMGVLGERKGPERANALKAQAAAYQKLTTKQVIMAYHLVAVIAQGDPGSAGKYRGRESTATMRALLDEARANDFKLILDVQPGRSSVADEVNWLRPMLAEPDVYLALDPEFSMPDGKIPGKTIGTMSAKDVNAAIDVVEQVIAANHLPPKVFIVHQFTWGMLPEKDKIRSSPSMDVVLDMDGLGNRSLKLSVYRDIIRQTPMAGTGFKFMGFKLFYRQDTNLLTPADVMKLTPQPSVVIYQ